MCSSDLPEAGRSLLQSRNGPRQQVGVREVTGRRDGQISQRVSGRFEHRTLTMGDYESVSHLGEQSQQIPSRKKIDAGRSRTLLISPGIILAEERLRFFLPPGIELDGLGGHDGQTGVDIAVPRANAQIVAAIGMVFEN